MTTDTKYKILLLDDDEFISDMYSVKFTQAGHEIHAHLTADDALEDLRNGFQPDAILTDLVMPKIDGFEFLGKIKEEGLQGDAIIIILSNQGESADLARSKELGSAGHIVKANTIPTEVLMKVEKMIEKHKNLSAS